MIRRATRGTLPSWLRVIIPTINRAQSRVRRGKISQALPMRVRSILAHSALRRSPTAFAKHSSCSVSGEHRYAAVERGELTLKREATRPPRLNSLQQQDRFDAFVHEFNTERPHEAPNMKCPAELYAASPRSYDGLPELTYPFHDRDVLVTACGRLCLHRKRINISLVLAGQKIGVKEVVEGIWLASFMHYDLGYFDLEQKALQPLDNPFGTRLSPIS